MAASRRGGRKWSDLSPAYRQRLERAGVDRRAWLGGADLRAARGRKPGPPPGAAPAEATERVVHGGGTRRDLDALDDWQSDQRNQGTDYGDLSLDTAAALSQISYPPERWDHVEFTPRGDGEPWTMTVYPKGGGYPETVDIPGGGAADTPGASEVLDWLTEEDIDYDVEGSG